MEGEPHTGGDSRRELLKRAAAAAAAAAIVALSGDTNAPAADPQNRPATAPAATGPGHTPWYRRTYRWGQTNITEADTTRYDIPWWRQYWRRTEAQGVIINAGGIFAYYPSKFPLHHRAAGLGDRDLYGEIARAAHDDGLAVLARMDSNRADEAFHKAHPDWFAVDAAGKPYRAGEQYVSCINSPYYEEYLPGILREIIGRSHPEGITDNSWSGLGRDSICYCPNCARRFRERAGKDLPRRRDWDDPVYRDWIDWSYARRLEIWDMNNRITRDAGGPDCLWLGMNSGSVSGQARSFRDLKEICARTEILMLDHQSRSDAGGFQDNAETGKLLHDLLGWDKLIPESMPMYQMGRPTFRLSAKPEPEARMWMLAGFAGGIQPWWHHIAAYHEDRRAYHTAGPILQWHKANEQYLLNRRPVATVGVVWSQRNTDFYGRDNPDERVDQPWRGMTEALVRARIPFVPIHADHIEREAPRLATLVLPNLAAMSDAQVVSVRRFVETGGGLVATGEASLFTDRGDPRPDFALADRFGVSGGKPAGRADRAGRAGADTRHTYLRLTPELRARVDGPKSGDEPPAAGERHTVLAGFDETDILPFGGTLAPLTVKAPAKVLLTYIPPFPMFPPETAWMRQPRTDIPGLVVSEPSANRGPVAYFPADIDRQFALYNLPDHGDLLANAVRWAAQGNIPLRVAGRGLIDCELYEQPGRLILHIVNLTSAGTWRAPVHELIPVGPFRVRIQVPKDRKPRRISLLVSGETRLLAEQNDSGYVDLKEALPPFLRDLAGAGTHVHFKIDSVLDHEVIVLEF